MIDNTAGGLTFIKCVITGDEAWIYEYVMTSKLYNNLSLQKSAETENTKIR